MFLTAFVFCRISVLLWRFSCCNVCISFSFSRFAYLPASYHFVSILEEHSCGNFTKILLKSVLALKNVNVLSFLPFIHQLMAASVCGPHGQHAVRRVGLVASQGAEHVLTPPLLMEDRTALGTTVRQRAVN